MNGYDFVDPATMAWRASTFAPGIEVKDLGTSDGRSMQLVRFAPGASFPLHTHAGPEFIYHLDGVAVQEGQHLPTGWAATAAAGTIDAQIPQSGRLRFPHRLHRRLILQLWTFCVFELGPYPGDGSDVILVEGIDEVFLDRFFEGADELVALARGFGVPSGWFFLPPESEDSGMHVPDKKARGMEFSEVVDLVLGTNDTNEPLPPGAAGLAAGAAGSTDQANERLAGRFADADRLEEARRLRETFGDLPEAAGVLRRLADAIDTLDKTAHEPTSTDTKKRRPPR